MKRAVNRIISMVALVIGCLFLKYLEVNNVVVSMIAISGVISIIND